MVDKGQKPFEITLTPKDIVPMAWGCVQCGEGSEFNWGAPQVIEAIYSHLSLNTGHLIEVYEIAKKGY